MRKSDKVAKVLAIVLVVILVVIVIAIVASGKKAKYTATVDTSSIAVVSPTTVSVSYHVKNIGKAAGTPSCTITVNDASDAHFGEDVVSVGSIKVGQTVTSADSITISNQGAQYVTQATINCK